MINDKYGLGKFFYNLRISSDRTKWNKHFMNEKLNSFKGDIEKVYLVGPVPFMEDIKTAIADSDLNIANKIYLV
jgi:hypothetical protein